MNAKCPRCFHELSPDLYAFECVGRAATIRAAWRAMPITEEGDVRERVAIVASTPSLAAAVRAGTAATEAAIVAELVAGGAHPAEAAIAAAAVMAALMTALLQWGAGGADGTLSAAIERALDVLAANRD